MFDRGWFIARSTMSRGLYAHFFLEGEKVSACTSYAKTRAVYLFGGASQPAGNGPTAVSGMPEEVPAI